MRNTFVRALSCLAFATTVWGQNQITPSPAIQENLLRLPLAFERQGEGASERFFAHGEGYSVGLESGKVSIGILTPGKSKEEPSRRAISMEFSGGKRVAATLGTELPGKINHISGNDPSRWQSGLSAFEKVTYSGVYPGIDVVYYGNQRQLEFDLVVRPGADPSSIRMKVNGADKLAIDSSGALSLGENMGGLRVALPQIFQTVRGSRKSVAGHYELVSRNEVAFRVDAFDHSVPLVIDPTIVYSTLLGGGLSSNIGNAIRLDQAGNILIAGYTFSADFPTVNAAQSSYKGNWEVFVTKVNAAGTALVYSTYLGGSSNDFAYGLAIDSTGAAWITGNTQSSDFPTLNASQPAFGGNTDAFVTKLSAAGVLQFSTFLGGSSPDYGYGVSLDGSDNAYITGYTNGPFPTTAGVVQTVSQGQDAFVTKFTPAGIVSYSTLLGGNSSDQGQGIAVDSAGNAFVTGYTFSPSFIGAPGGGAQSVNMGSGDAFVAKLNPTATVILYFTFLGGSALDQGKAISLDSSGNTYIAGQTSSSGLATAGALQPSIAGATDGFVAKINAAGSSFSYITYLGGSRSESFTGMALDSSGSVYLTGYTASPNFPIASAVQPALAGNGASLSRTINSGISWSALDSQIPGAVFDVSFAPSGSSAVALTEAGLYRTTNGGASWTQQLTNPAVAGTSYFARSLTLPSTLYAAICCTSILKSVDDGITWNTVGNLPSQPVAVMVDPSSASIVYALGSNSPYVYKSSDGGATWAAAASGLPATRVVTIAATTDGAIYVGSQGSGVYRSTNQGGSWVVVSGLPANSVSYYSSLSAAGTTLYFAYGSIYKSTNGGSTWASTPTYVGAGGVAVSPQNTNVIYAFTYNGTIQVSSDGGTTWNAAGVGLPTGLQYYNTNSHLYVDTGNSAQASVIAPANQNAFVSKLNPTGSALLWSTYLGGTASAQAFAIAADAGGNAFVTGTTNGGGFPVTSSALPSGTFGAFLTKISDVTAACSALSISPPNQIISQYGQTLTFSVVAPSGCSWTASTNQAWAAITSPISGTGNGAVTIQTSYSSAASSQSAVLTVGTQTATIAQAGFSCNFSLDKSSYAVPSGGGTISPNLTVGAACPWNIVNNYAGAISFTSASSGLGSATIGLSVTANPSASTRNFNLSVGTTQIQIVQPGNVLAVATTSLPVAAVGTYYSALLSASGGSLPYSAWGITGSLPPACP